MNQALAIQDTAALMEKVVIGGDLSKLTPTERVGFYRATCESLGLNPLTKPFDYITLNGKLTLYARKDATEQLRKIHGVSVTKLEREVHEGIFTVTAYLEDGSGRKDSSIGAVSIESLKGEAKANALMKAETKAKRRGTLSICGLGVLDETEVETIPDAKPFVESGTQLELAATRPEEIERKLAESCLIAVMETECFTDQDRKGCQQFLAKNPTLAAVKKKLRDKQEWAEAWSKEALAASGENLDADSLIPGTASQQEAF